MKELLVNLSKLGFSQYEAKAYIALLETPRVSAYELARQSGIPPSKIYETMERLVLKKLVVALDVGGHTKYAPLDPEEAVARYRQTYANILDSVEEGLQRVRAADVESAEYVWNLVDHTDISRKAVEMIDGCTDEVYLGVWPNELPTIRTALEEADLRGVAIAICLYGEEDPGVGIVYHHDTDRVVLRDQGSRRMVLVTDSSEALIAYFPEAGQVTGVWSTNMGFVQMAKDYIRHDMWIIKLVRRFESSINAVYGADREKLRDIFAPLDSEATFARATDRRRDHAQDEVRLRSARSRSGETE